MAETGVRRSGEVGDSKGPGRNKFAIWGVDTLGWQGARRANSRSIQATSNAASRGDGVQRAVSMRTSNEPTIIATTKPTTLREPAASAANAGPGQ